MTSDNDYIRALEAILLDIMLSSNVGRAYRITQDRISHLRRYYRLSVCHEGAHATMEIQQRIDEAERPMVPFMSIGMAAQSDGYTLPWAASTITRSDEDNR